MPALPGFEVRTHPLPAGREIDVLHRPDEIQHILVPAIQVAVLSGTGLRADGLFSVSDVSQAMDPIYIVRVPDKRRLYSRTRATKTTLFAVPGLVQKSCRTISAGYVRFCREFLDHVVPQYPAFVAYHRELLVAWQAAIDFFDVTGKGPEKSFFAEAITARDARLAVTPEPPPEVVDRPLPGVPAIFNGVDCPAFGTYEVPMWVGLYVCDVLGLANPHQALSRILDEDKGVLVISTPGGPQSHVMLKESGVYELISTSHKPEARRFKSWLFREVLPQIRKYGFYATNGAKVGLTAEEVREILLALLNEKIEPIARAVRAHNDEAHQEAVIKLLTLLTEQNLETTRIHQEQLKLLQQSIDLVTPSHQLLLPASDYFEVDDVAEALKQAPKLAVPVFGIDHCPDHGTASLFMKLLCREEDKKVAKNTVDRIMAEHYGEEVPPLYIPRFRMEKREREHVRVLMFSAPCWAFLKQTFLPHNPPTLLFPGPKVEPAPPETGKTEEA